MKKLIFLLGTLISLNAFSGGGTVGNGGDAISQEFTFLATELVSYLPYLPANTSFSLEQRKAYATAVQETKVNTQDHLTLNGVEVDAINYPDKKVIEVSRSRWALLSSDPEVKNKRQAIALHEYLWIAGIDDTNYRYSTPLFKELMVAKAKWLSPPIARGLTQAICSGIVTRDVSTVQQALVMGADLEMGCEDVEYSCTSPSYQFGTVFTHGHKPLEVLLEKFGNGGVCDGVPPLSADLDLTGIDILKLLLAFHPDLTGAAQLAAERKAFVAFDLLVDAGVAEDDAIYGLMSRYSFAPVRSFEKVLDKKFNFNKSMPIPQEDLLTTAIIVSGNRQDVLGLFASRFAIDFCAISASPVYNLPKGPVISFLRPQYLPIVQKYGGACVP